MKILWRQGLIWVLLCAGISALWGTSLASSENAWIDFRALFAGARCLIHRHDPYNVSDLSREYASEDGQRPSATLSHLQGIVYCINLPATLILVTPLALLNWKLAQVLWMLLTGFAFVLAVLLTWLAGTRHAPRIATVLACVLAINCESIYSSGNSAGLVVGFCGIAVWCFLEGRFVRIGIVCLAIALAVKPHDAGFVWLLFILCGGVFRQRALQSAAIAAVLSLASILWVAHVAPHWMRQLDANIAATTARGGINDCGPSSAVLRDGALYSVVDLQGAISIFYNNPRVYNAASYAICGALLLIWSIRSLRVSFTVPNAWLALAPVTALTLLITYHRLWDAKLLILVIPACCALWVEGTAIGKAAFWITAIACLFTGEISLVLFEMAFGSFDMGGNRIMAHAINVVLTRPASLALLTMAIFYLWVYIRRTHEGRPFNALNPNA